MSRGQATLAKRSQTSGAVSTLASRADPIALDELVRTIATLRVEGWTWTGATREVMTQHPALVTAVYGAGEPPRLDLVLQDARATWCHTGVESAPDRSEARALARARFERVLSALYRQLARQQDEGEDVTRTTAEIRKATDALARLDGVDRREGSADALVAAALSSLAQAAGEAGGRVRSQHRRGRGRTLDAATGKPAK